MIDSSTHLPVMVEKYMMLILAFIGVFGTMGLLLQFHSHKEATRTVLTFAPNINEPIAMHYEASSVHYKVDDGESDDEYAHLLPPDGHTIHITTSSGILETHTVTLFHQLKCLDIIRKEYAYSHPSTPELTQHCLTYLHQTILCRPYFGLEVTKNVAATARKSRELVCRNWEAVYEEAQENWRGYRVLEVQNARTKGKS